MRQQWSDDEEDLHDDSSGQPRAKRHCSNRHNGGYGSDHTAVTEYEEASSGTGTNSSAGGVWTQQHLEAADIRVPPSMMTPPSHVSRKVITFLHKHKFIFMHIFFFNSKTVH